MSLNYDLSKVDHYNDMTEAERDAEWATTQGMIFQTMGVGLGEITEDNAVEFYIRQRIWNKLHGFPPYTVEQVRQYIGLKTNVSDETSAQWRKRLIDSARRDAAYKYKQWVGDDNT